MNSESLQAATGGMVGEAAGLLREVEGKVLREEGELLFEGEREKHRRRRIR